MELCNGAQITVGQIWVNGNGEDKLITSTTDTDVDGFPVVDDLDYNYSTSGQAYVSLPEYRLVRPVNLQLVEGQVWVTKDGVEVVVGRSGVSSLIEYPRWVDTIDGTNSWSCTEGGVRYIGDEDDKYALSYRKPESDSVRDDRSKKVDKPAYRVGQVWKGSDPKEFTIVSITDDSIEVTYDAGKNETTFKLSGRLSDTYQSLYDWTTFVGYAPGFKPELALSQRWKTRNGIEVVVKEHDTNDEDYPFLVYPVSDPNGGYWVTAQGTEYEESDTGDDGDLVELLGWESDYDDSPDAPSVKFEFKVGQKYKTRSGDTATIAQITTGNPADFYPIGVGHDDGFQWHATDGRLIVGAENDGDLVQLLAEPVDNGIVKKFEVGERWQSRNCGIATIEHISNDPDDDRPYRVLFADGDGTWVNKFGRVWPNSYSKEDLLYLYFDQPVVGESAEEDDPWARIAQQN